MSGDASVFSGGNGAGRGSVATSDKSARGRRAATSRGGIAVVLNPKSRHNLRNPGSQARLERIVGDAGVVCPAATPDELARVVDAIKAGADLLAISGGDGTNHVVLSALLAAWDGGERPLPAIVLLRGGTMNTVANAIGVPRGNPESLLEAAVGAYRARGVAGLRTVERHVMRMGERDVGFLFGTGAIHGFISEYNRAELPGPVHAAEILARASASALFGGEFVKRIARRWEGRVTFADGSAFPDRDYMAIGAGTIDQIGLGFRPFYRASDHAGEFHLLGIHTSAPGFVKSLPRVRAARGMGEERAFERVADFAVLESRTGVVDFICDGDVHSHRGPLTLAIGPRFKIAVAFDTPAHV